MGVKYELALGPVRRGKRDALESLSGQRHYPVIEFEDGSVYREQSKDMERDDPRRQADGSRPRTTAAEPSG